MDVLGKALVEKTGDSVLGHSPLKALCWQYKGDCWWHHPWVIASWKGFKCRILTLALFFKMEILISLKKMLQRKKYALNIFFFLQYFFFFFSILHSKFLLIFLHQSIHLFLVYSSSSSFQTSFSPYYILTKFSSDQVSENCQNWAKNSLATIEKNVTNWIVTC